MNDPALLSINDAVAQGITKLRRPIWAEPMDHLVINIHQGEITPWIKLHCPANQAVNNRDPVDVLVFNFDLDDKLYVLYEGPDHESDEYIAMRENYSKRFEET